MTELDLKRRAEALTDSDRITQRTRAVLRARIDGPTGEPRLFTAAEMRTLRAVAARLVPDGGLDIDLAARLDAALAGGPGDGWRYADTPPAADAWRRGLAALDGAAAARFGGAFAALGAGGQDDILKRVQAGSVDGGDWRGLPPRRWFELALTTLAQLRYAHPAAQAEIGYDGFADAHGWQDIGLPKVDPGA